MQIKRQKSKMKKTQKACPFLSLKFLPFDFCLLISNSLRKNSLQAVIAGSASNAAI
jgi:hypothetical protein